MKETNSQKRNTVVVGVVVRSFVAVLLHHFLLFLLLFSFLLMILSILLLLLMFNVFDFICEFPNHIRSCIRERKVFFSFFLVFLVDRFLFFFTSSSSFSSNQNNQIHKQTLLFFRYVLLRPKPTNLSLISSQSFYLLISLCFSAP